jgi:hypothetical protein
MWTAQAMPDETLVQLMHAVAAEQKAETLPS